jgi:hypothetical protein
MFINAISFHEYGTVAINRKWYGVEETMLASEARSWQPC